ncbi:protein inscuteable homolog [Petromyzon marinus]|uniref:protein inscuteable homolog n=1 Tax=Petromyzon marinus TaxID=7757 RepID=UPI003F6F2376
MGVGKGVERAPSEASPIRQWLAELRVETQAEAMATMDGKALGGDGTRSWEDGDIQAGICSSGGLVGGSGAPPACCALMRRARHVSAELARLFRRLEGARSHRPGGGHHPASVEASRGGAPWRRVHAGALRLACHARAAVTQMRATSPAASSQCAQDEIRLLDSCRKLESLGLRCAREGGADPLGPELGRVATQVGRDFSGMLASALTHLAQELVRKVGDISRPRSLIASLGDLLALARGGDHMCHIVAREGGVRALVRLVRARHCPTHVLAASLRTLASLASVSLGRDELIKEDGVSSLAHVLEGRGQHSEAVRAEAAAVLAQVLAPHATSGPTVKGPGLDGAQALRVVGALTELCGESSCGEVFLLGAAALASISFLGPAARDAILEAGTARVLLRRTMRCEPLVPASPRGPAGARGPPTGSAGAGGETNLDPGLNSSREAKGAGPVVGSTCSPYAKDQVVTVLANLAVTERGRAEVMSCQGLVLLMSCLEAKPAVSASPGEVAACERGQQRAAVALARLARSPSACRTAVHLGCVSRLAVMCRVPAERSHSDGVLLACLAAVRRLGVACPGSLGPLDSLQLVTPRLRDAFLLCSETRESFV